MFDQLTELLTSTYAVPIASFGAIGAASWLLLDWLSPQTTKAEQRLKSVCDPRSTTETQQSATESRAKAVSRVLERTAPAFAKPLQPTREVDAGKLKSKLQQAGFHGSNAANVFLGLKIACLLAGMLVCGSSLVAIFTLNSLSILRAAIIAISSFYLPDVGLWFLTRQRKEQIFLGLPDALDLMVVCVEAGLGIDAAMRKVAEEMGDSCRVLSEEFGRCNMQLQMGRPRNAVLKDLGERTGTSDLRSLASILVQTEKFGSSIARALRVHSDAMRSARRQIAEEKAAKTAVQLIFPLVLFIFPAVFVVLVGPAAITMIREMLPLMSS
ncbi:MAG: type II secretion system F family protein [Planctomycetota bacterium]|nr:type II secretion system F family protein [Planctomycetota bacterium]